MRPALLVILAAATLRGDALGDLKAALQRLPGNDGVKGMVELRITRQTLEDKKPVLTRGHASCQVEDGPKGLKLSFTKEDLQHAATEGRAQMANPDKLSPHRLGLREADALDVEELLNHADALARYLDKATLVEERREAWNGRPTRVVVLRVDPPLPQSQRRYLKKVDVNARIWIGEDGAPVALSYQATYSGSRFFISFKGSIAEERRFAVVGDRLVVLHRSVEESASGFGFSYANQRTAAFTPER
jgi:hypothetical protein